MTHLKEDELAQVYYGEAADYVCRHLDGCSHCRLSFERFRELFDALRDYPVPERNTAYGSEVFARILPHLPERKSRFSRFRLWFLAPALATLLAIAFIAGMITQRRQSTVTLEARERVLLMEMSEHLERSQIILTELVNAAPGTVALSGERDRARELLTENRLLRQTAMRLGDRVHADLLDQLERVLLDLANSPSDASSKDIRSIQERIEDQGLLFKVRVTSADAREKGQKL